MTEQSKQAIRDLDDLNFIHLTEILKLNDDTDTETITLHQLEIKSIRSLIKSIHSGNYN